MKYYYGITYPYFLGLFRPIWRKLFCRKKFHLLDEVFSDNQSYLVCDACQLVIEINSIDTGKVIT